MVTFMARSDLLVGAGAAPAKKGSDEQADCKEDTSRTLVSTRHARVRRGPSPAKDDVMLAQGMRAAPQSASSARRTGCDSRDALMVVGVVTWHIGC
jgi:hypothetical protein